ncbi:Hsp20/alpha crystallin family protein [Rhizosphaericola mali]|uniref:Hsp20/alpha crystallin family protein n=1 Tax=Rhizosphaericola mali TaxID=2545455 RepID=A0A5P2G7R9_9BACT|nr:Hsp20/alpha crystallin family protein [Rhizosphaericola mali]QES90319.1 Hsp20/alpha crystallin family protein [Rhizosphaericola mali]
MSTVKKYENPFNGFPKLLDDFFGHELSDWRNNNFSETSTTIPSANIKETADNYQVELAAPGLEKSDFDIKLEDCRLIISSLKKQENETKEDKYTRREFSYQSFQRSFTLPRDIVDVENIKAQYENGLLTIDIPKKEEAKKKAPKLIEIG